MHMVPAMNTTLTIRNLEEPVKQLLRMQAANHKRSMEAEARDILTRAVTQSTSSPANAQGLASDAAKNAVASADPAHRSRACANDTPPDAPPVRS